MLLEVRDLCKQFSGLKAVNNLSFSVKKHSISGLIGPNGAGKTTSFNCLTGTLTASSGHIFFDGEDVTQLKPYQIAEKGMIRTFQQNKLFPEMTVFENILIGMDRNSTVHPLKELFGFQKLTKNRPDISNQIEEILEFTGLLDEKDFLAKNLSHGSQRRLAIAIAMACRPKMLLLDEPATGMNPEETHDLMKLIQKINTSGITILIIEHDMKLVMNMCEHITVLSFGEKLAEGTPDEIVNNRKVIEAYLGRGTLY